MFHVSIFVGLWAFTPSANASVGGPSSEQFGRIYFSFSIFILSVQFSAIVCYQTPLPALFFRPVVSAMDRLQSKSRHLKDISSN